MADETIEMFNVTDFEISNNGGPYTGRVIPQDVFRDIEALRINQDFIGQTGFNKELVTVPVRKPSKEWFIRTHPSPEMQLQSYLLELKEDMHKEQYLVLPHVAASLQETTISPYLLRLAINRQDVVFIWPLRLPNGDGWRDDWSRSAEIAANTAEEKWVRLQSNMSLRAYEVCTATSNIPDPVWPDKTLGELLRIAFKDRVIDSVNHDILKTLRGEI